MNEMKLPKSYSETKTIVRNLILKLVGVIFSKEMVKKSGVVIQELE